MRKVSPLDLRRSVTDMLLAVASADCLKHFNAVLGNRNTRCPKLLLPGIVKRTIEGKGQKLALGLYCYSKFNSICMQGLLDIYIHP